MTISCSYEDINPMDVLNRDTKIIYSFTPLDRSLCIKLNEVQSLLNYYPFGNAHRICFAIMASAGLRTAEVCKLTINSFLNPDCTKIRYAIAKCTTRKYSDTGTIVKNIKVRTVSIPSALGKEIRWYIEHNYHLFKNGRLFLFEAPSLRRYWSKLRDRARNNNINDILLKNALLETVGERVCIGTLITPQYRVSLHSFRRFYLTFIYNNVYNKDVVMVQREIGHTLKETTYAYLYKPEQAGLNPQIIAKKKGIDTIFNDPEKKRLHEF